jgi:ATP-binding cassette, subfamily F, member 3
VETVEALATALAHYEGTVIFTSHDRHFLKRVASCVVEVCDGRVMNYQGNYGSYLYRVNQEIAAGERELVLGREKTAAKKGGSSSQSERPKRADDRQLRKELANLEKAIARFGEQKSELNSRLLYSTDPAEALRLHNELNDIVKRLDHAESRWLELQDALEADRSK